MLPTFRWVGLLLICLAAFGCAAGTQTSPQSDLEHRKHTSEMVSPPPSDEVPSPQFEPPFPPQTQENIHTVVEENAPSPHDLTLPLPPQFEEEEATPPRSPAATANGFTYDVPVVRNAIVDRWIDYFTGPGRERFEEWLRRSGRYISLFQQILREKGLPQDLAYVPLIESGFNLRAHSRAGAAGPWQFMPSTARRMGLKVNYYVDERRDPVKATDAAAEYLSELYQEFNDWHLALAAYNAGERRVRVAMERANKKSYWAVARTRHLPQETRNYVGKFLAGLIIAKHPEVFGFTAIDFLNPVQYDVVTLPRGIMLNTLANLAGVPVSTLSNFNPQLRMQLTPPGKGHQIYLPSGKGDGILDRLARLPRHSYPAAVHYRIRPGDTFGAIARRLNVPLQALLRMNAHLDPRRLRVGTEIAIPRSGVLTASTASSTQTPPPPSHHTVVKGENIWVIAKRYGMAPEELLRINQLSASTTIFPGDRLRIQH